jgi:Sensors of blue-light using FAD
MLIQLTYASRSLPDTGPEDVKEILHVSQRNNALLGLTGALCVANGIFLQQLEGDSQTVNQLYCRLLNDPRHKDIAILDFSEITCRRFAAWNMGLIPSVADNRQLFLKYSSNAHFDPYLMSPTTLRAFFDEVMQNVRWLS